MEEVQKCISCGERPIEVEKWKRCHRCYQRYRHKYVGRFHDRKVKGVTINYVSEIEFIRNFFEHQNWIYQPAIFRFNGEQYRPDFYDGERNAFIEVVGTPQAYYDNREKYKEFIGTFPKINFEIRQINGDLVDLDEKLHFNKK